MSVACTSMHVCCGHVGVWPLFLYQLVFGLEPVALPPPRFALFVGDNGRCPVGHRCRSSHVKDGESVRVVRACVDDAETRLDTLEATLLRPRNQAPVYGSAASCGLTGVCLRERLHCKASASCP